MNRQRFNEIVESFVAKEMPLMTSKGADYSSNEEALRNFKETSKITGLLPSQVAMVYLLKHISSINGVVFEKTQMDVPIAWASERDGVLVEGLLQKISDARNYLAIIAMCLEDESGVRCEF